MNHTRDGIEGGVALGPRLEELLALQEEYFGRLEALAEEQTALVESERAAELLELLARRQRLVDGIAEIGTILEPWRERWEQVMNGLPDEQRARVRRRLDAIAGVAARIAQRDAADRANLARRRDAVAEELGQIGRARGAVAAYGGGVGTPAARFQDREA